MVNLIERTFLAEIKGGEVQIVHPLFDDGLYTHNPVTTSYGKYTLINLLLLNKSMYISRLI